MLNRVQTFSRWLFLVLASLVLAACGSGDGDNVLPGNGVSNYQLTLNGATSVGASGSITLTATLLDPTGIAVPNATINFVQTGAGSLGATSATTDATGVATVTVNGTTTTSGSGTVTARYTDPRSNIAQDPHTYVVSSGDQVLLVLSKTQVKSGVGDSVTITAKVTDASGAFVANRLVTFTRVGNGGIEVTQPVTDSTGTATAVFTPGIADFSNRNVEIIASTTGGSAPAIEGRATIQVIGTTVSLSSSAGNNVTIGNAINVTATVRDGQNVAIPNVTVTFSSANGNTFTPVSAITNASGQATVNTTINTAAGGNETITGTVSSLNANGSLALAVTTTSFAFQEPALNAELNTGTNHTIRVRWTVNGVAQSGQTVFFNSTRGTLSAPSAVTNGSGDASVTVNSGFAGIATIEAQTTGGALKVSRVVEFVAPAADLVTVQVARNVLKSGEQTAVTAIVRDAGNINPVKNALVSFSLPIDPSGGALSAATAITDSAGQATVTYTAGPITSPTNGVTIQASLPNGNFSNTSLTVGSSETATFITLGTGNSLRELNSTTYALPYSVLLTDAAGQPLANQTVTLSIIPLNYYKGVYVVVGDFWSPSVSVECPNEDTNRNGLLDVGEDANADGNLQPGNVVTVSAGTVTTNSSGFANFDVLYSQQFGNWIQVALKASATVTGSESVNTAVFVPPILADDARVAQAPPGRAYSNPAAVGSPFGRSASCADTL